ncbi:MAG: glycosyltransferase family 4 protein [Planctomycetota bacterium]
MRIALIILHDDPARGGAERYTRDLAASLTQHGHDARIVAASSTAGAVTLPASGASRSGLYRDFCNQLTPYLAAESFDLVHAMLPLPPGVADLYHPHAGVATAEHPTRSGKWLSWLSNPRRRLFAKVERDMLRAPPAPVTLTLSQYVEDQLRRDHPAATARRLFNGVDVARFCPDGPAIARDELGLSKGAVAGLFVGNDPVRKGLREAMNLLPAFPRFHLLVAGRFDTKSYEAAGRQLGVGPRVHFLGPRDDVPALYRSADLLVQLTRHDPCSLATLEALASGLPVLSTKTNGATEVMTSGVHGEVIDAADDGEAARAAVRRLLDGETLADARQACTQLRPLLSWQTHVDTLVDIYADLLQARAERA